MFPQASVNLSENVLLTLRLSSVAEAGCESLLPMLARGEAVAGATHSHTPALSTGALRGVKEDL